MQDLSSFEALRRILFFPDEGLPEYVQEMHSCPAENPSGLSQENCRVIGICIEGAPIPKQRARHVRRGSFIATYDPQDKQKSAFRKALFLELFHSNVDFLPPNHQLEAFFIVNIEFYLPIPVSSTNTHRNAKLRHIQHHIQKPDLDNLVKFVLDCGNGILFNDDCQIVQLSAKKLYCEYPRTEIKLTIMEKIHLHETAEKIINIFEPKMFLEMVEDMRVLCEMSNEFKHNLTHSQQEAFFSLLANHLAHFMRQYGGHLSKMKKHQEFSLTTQKWQECMEILYGK